MKVRTLFVIALLIPGLMLTSSCEYMEQHKAQTGAVAGAIVGTLAGAAIGHQSGNTGAGAALGGLVGAGVGAAIGYGIQEWQNSQAEHAGSKPYSVNGQSSPEVQTATVSQTVPEVPILEVFDTDSKLLPSSQLRPGDQLQAILVFRSVPKTTTNRTLNRRDILKIYDPKKQMYCEVKKFEEDTTLPATGINQNETKFTIPAQAPKGNYQLVSTVYDPEAPTSIAATKDFSFSVVN